MKSRLKATNLVEVILYVSLLSVLILSLGSFFSSIITTRNKQRAITEVETEVKYISEIIEYDVKRATSVSVPATGTTGSTITLSINESGTPETRIYSVSGGRIMQQINASPAVALTSNKVTISSLSFVHTYTAPSFHIISISFNAAFAKSSGTADSTYSTSYRTSIEQRINL